MKKITVTIVLALCVWQLQAQKIEYVSRFANENHPEIGYWFFSPNLLENDKYLPNIDSITAHCPYTLIFLTAREGANFYDYKIMHDVFKKIVAAAHKKGVKIGLQLWNNPRPVPLEVSHRLIVETEVTLDQSGNASYTAKSRFIRFPDRLLKSDLFRVYAFKKTGAEAYDPSTLKDITKQCETTLPDKETVEIRIKGGESVKGLTACIMTQQYCSQSSAFGEDEAGRFYEAIEAYKDIPFDGFALDEYGNKFVSRIMDMKPGELFRGRWYSEAMATEYQKATGKPLDKTLFEARYAPFGKPEPRIKAINSYMDFMRKGVTRVESKVYDRSREVFGKQIFNGIHDTYHNSLINDEIWANGIAWWNVKRAYGQTDEKTPTATQMGVAMAHPMNAMYNQYYDKDLEPVTTKALFDLRYGIRTHYHALNDHRPLRFDLEEPEAVKKINRVENCARLLNKFNPLLPEVKLLVVFGMEALSNWYPYEADRGIYDINDKMEVEARAVEVWKGGYLNALVPSELITSHTLTIGEDGKPVMNGHKFDAIVYLNPQYAKEEEIKFLETYVNKGGKLMIEGRAEYDFEARNITERFKTLYSKATVQGYSLANIAKLGLQKNLLPDGCKTEDGAYVYTDYESLNNDKTATFSVTVNGIKYTGAYKGLAVISFDDKNNVKKFTAAGCKDLTRNGETILSFNTAVDVFAEKKNGQWVLTIGDGNKTIKPSVNKL